MKAVWIAVALAACEPSHRFWPDPQHPAPVAQIVDCAVLADAPDGADKLGRLDVHGRSFTEAVAKARRYAARAGGTHIVVRGGDVTTVHHDPQPEYSSARGRQARASESTYIGDVLVQFDVYRAEVADQGRCHDVDELP